MKHKSLHCDRRTTSLGALAVWVSLVISTSALAITRTTTTLNAEIVASSCTGQIVTDNGTSTVDFGVINLKDEPTTWPTRQFSLKLSETGISAETSGCSAFTTTAYSKKYGARVHLTFADSSTDTQLDADGVKLYHKDSGEEANLRVHITPKDTGGSQPQWGSSSTSSTSASTYVSSDFRDLAYDIDFAAKGVFPFTATLHPLAGKTVRSGAFSGTLTVTVNYQ